MVNILFFKERFNISLINIEKIYPFIPNIGTKIIINVVLMGFAIKLMIKTKIIKRPTKKARR